MVNVIIYYDKNQEMTLYISGISLFLNIFDSARNIKGIIVYFSKQSIKRIVPTNVPISKELDKRKSYHMGILLTIWEW